MFGCDFQIKYNLICVVHFHVGRIVPLFLGFLESVPICGCQTLNRWNVLCVSIFLKFFIRANNLFKAEYERAFHLWERSFSHAFIHSKNINLSCDVIMMCTVSLYLLLFWDICTFA